MAYIGQQPVVGRYILLDQISGGFNGTATGFTMSTAGGAQGVIPGLAQNVLLSLGGVIQQPGVDYTISGSGLTFTTPPVSGTTFFATVLGDAQSVGTPSDGTVTPASIASGYNFNFANLNVTGVVTIASGSAASPSLTITGDLNTGIYSPGADQVAISTSGTGRLFVDAAGDVGVNYSTPGDGGSKFQVEGSIGLGGSDETQSLSIGRVDSGAVNPLANISMFGAGAGDFKGTIVFSTNSAGFFDSPCSERLRITSDGKVGVGTTSPSYSLHVDGSCAVAGDKNLRLGEGSFTYYYDLGRDASTGKFVIDGNQTGSVAYSFRKGGTSLVDIDNSGRLLVGATSGSYQLELSTDSAGKPSTNTWTIVSDERIKEEIELADLDLCYEAVKNIPLKRFKWKDEVYTEEQAYDRRKLGWIAQDVEAVFPKAVRQHEFKYNQIFKEVIVPAVPEELDDDGNVVTEAQPERIEKGELISEEVIEDCRDLNSDQLYAAMYGAIQKLIGKVETLEAKVAALETP